MSWVAFEFSVTENELIFNVDKENEHDDGILYGVVIISGGSMKTHMVSKDFPVVCVGGSASGLDAYIRLLKHLPINMGVAIVIVNHLRTVATMLHEILPRFTKMPVELITEKLEIQPNHVFIIPEKRDLHVLNGEFRLKPFLQICPIGLKGSFRLKQN